MLDVEVADGVMTMTMRREAKRNAVDRELADQLDRAFARAEREAGVRVVVLTGAGGFFSAGTDLNEDASPATESGGEYGFVRRRRTKPLIAAVEGFALGGGFEMVLACDLVVAARDAVFGLPEVRRGVVANCGAFFRAPDRLPPSIAVEMLLTGDPVDAEQAHRFGLVNVVADPGGAVESARILAARIVRNSPASVAATLAAIADARTESEARLWSLTERAAAEAAASPDRAEGIAAFFEKRPPHWATPEPDTP